MDAELREPEETRGRWLRRPEGLLVVGSALLLASAALVLVAVVLTFLGSDATFLGWVALGTDPVGAVLLGWSFHSQSDDLDGPARSWSRAAGWLFVVWASLAVAWRFVVPFLISTNLASLFSELTSIAGTVPSNIALRRGEILGILVLWVVAAIVFVTAEIAVIRSVRLVPKEDWMRDLPTRTWLAAASVSLLGTVLLAQWMATALEGNPSGNPLAGNVAKLVLAPNLFLSSYVASLRLGWDVKKAAERPETAGLQG